MSTLHAGARVAVRTCLNIGPDDRVFIITDEPTLAVGQALADEAAATGAVVTVQQLENYGERPLRHLPPALAAAYRDMNPTASFFAAAALPGEISFRIELGDFIRGLGTVRHGHMPGITPLLMTDGMLTDYNRVYALTMRVYELARQARRLRVTNPKGTDLTATFRPDRRWVPSHGRYHRPGDWGNLPEGETFTCPDRVDGVVVADVLGDYFSEKYGLLAHPVRFVIADSRVQEVSCADAALAAEVWDYLRSAENGDRVGELAIGTNIGLTRLVGNLLQDEKFPGLHLAFGNPYPQRTGADWTSSIHVDVIPTFCTIELDGRRLLTDGVYEPDILADL